MFFKTDFGMDVIYFVMWLLSREIMKMNVYMYYIEYVTFIERFVHSFI